MRILRWIDLLANTHLACTLWKWWSTCYCRVLWWTRFWIRGVHTAMRFHIWSHVHKDIWISLIENCIWTDRHPLMQCSNLELYYCACNKIKQKKWLDIPKKNASINHWNFQMKIQRMLLSFTNHIKGTNTTFRIYFVQRLIVYSGPRNLQEITSKTWLNFSRKISWYHRFREKSKLANIFWMMVQEGYIGTKNRDWKTNSSGTKPGFNIFSVHNLNIEPCLEPLRN